MYKIVTSGNVITFDVVFSAGNARDIANANNT
jgi:hypothetical protein